MKAAGASFRRLSLITACAVYLLMVVGGVVRITESGLGCPDWPLCHGRLIPPMELTAIIEYTHRSVALIGGVLILATAIMAWKQHRADRWITVPAVAVIALLVIQIPLGALVVATDLRPVLVSFHLAMAMVIFACSLMTMLAARRGVEKPSNVLPAWYFTLLVSTLAALFVLMVTGAMVVNAGASHICDGWPLCGKGEWTLGTMTPAEAISMYHRYVVASVSVLVVATVIQTLRLARPAGGLRGWAMVLVGLFVLQVIIGAVQVTNAMPTVWRVLHLATATGVWAALVSMTGITLHHRAAWASAHNPLTPVPSPTRDLSAGRWGEGGRV